jgi:formiminotetrahydrofolate cyclodeaminase
MMIRSHPPMAWEPQDHTTPKGGSAAADGTYLDAPLCSFLDQIAAREPAPGGGAAAAMTVAMAAALAAMAARFATSHLDAATDLCTHAEMLRARVAPLAQADAAAYQRVIEAMRLPGKPNAKAAKARNLAIRKTLDHAAEVPLRVAEVGADVAKLAATLAQAGNPNLRGDAATAGQLAAAGARAAATLVAINVGAGDPRALRAGRLGDAAGHDAAQALRAAGA